MGVAQKVMSNPKAMELIQKVQKNPRILAAVTECMRNPEAIAKYQNDPEIKVHLDQLRTILKLLIFTNMRSQGVTAMLTVPAPPPLSSTTTTSSTHKARSHPASAPPFLW